MHRPEKPSIASRACVVSASSMNFFVSGLPQNSRGSKPKSPAARPEPFAGLHDGDHRRQLGHRREQQHDAHVARREHGVVGVQGVDARVLLAREVDARVHREPPHDREHADAAVLELGLAHPVDHGDLGVLAHPPLLGDDHLGHVPVRVGEP